ncbi:MAG: electron transfer flavoprotein subunit alpha/FixB family protein [Chloroflexota bacterium]|nr:electron transfer flavoprotein subunit alpha/FixB family protein [Chloroflexota bacterium]
MEQRDRMLEIWAVLEHTDGILHEQNSELLAELSEVAQQHQKPTRLCAVLLTSPNTSQPDTTLLSTLDIQQLYVIKHPLLAQYTTEGYVDTLSWLLQQHSPLLVATGATANGRDWAPRLAARLHLPYVSNCLRLQLDDTDILALRSAYEGRAYMQTRTAFHAKTALATLVPGIRGKPINPIESTQAEVHITIFTPHLEHVQNELQIRSLGISAPSPEAVQLDVAERIVAGGRGIGQEGFTNVAAFARLLSAAVGATRVATDRGWIEHDRQIGATGKSVHPKLYIACGISGAAQHTSGISDSQTIVAINPDRSAPIFAMADLGLLGDANQILQLAAEKIDQLRQIYTPGEAKP